MNRPRDRVDRGPPAEHSPSRLKVSVLAGMSASVAVAVNVSVLAFGDRLVADRGQERGLVDFGDGDGDRLGVGLPACRCR